MRTLVERAEIPVALTVGWDWADFRRAPAEHGHDGHARRGMGESRYPGVRSADRVRYALRRPRYVHAFCYATKCKKIHIEVDPTEINKNVVDVALVGDLREVLEQLLPQSFDTRDGSAWLKTIEASKGASQYATSTTC